MITILCYNPKENNFIDFLHKLTLNFDNAFSVLNKITLMAGYNISYLSKSDKDKKKSIITPHGLKIFRPSNETQVGDSAKTHITALVAMEPTKTRFVLIHLIKRNILFHIMCQILNVERSRQKIIQSFNKDNYP